MEDVLNLCRKMLAGDLDLVEGCRSICFARSRLPAHVADSPLLMPFIGFESELHEFPIGESRKYWSARALAEQDRKLATYVEQAKPALLEACRTLLADWAERESPPGREVILGAEYDAELRAVVLQVLSDMRLTQSASSWVVGGSQEVEKLTASSGGRSVTLTAETYIGLSASGDPELVAEIEKRVRTGMQNRKP